MTANTSQLSALLARAAEGGEPRACAAIIERVMDRLILLARRMLRAYPRLRRWEGTDDVFQETAIRLCRALKELKPRTAGELFALATLQTRRTLIDLARHHFGPLGEAGRHDSDPRLFDGRKPRVESLAAADRSCEPQSMAEWTAFHEAVGALPEPERQVFEFIWYGGATYAEAAGLLKVARRTVIRRMNRARLKLADSAVGVSS